MQTIRRPKTGALDVISGYCAAPGVGIWLTRKPSGFEEFLNSNWVTEKRGCAYAQIIRHPYAA